MTIRIGLAAVRNRVERQMLGDRQLDDLATAAQEYSAARCELIALRATCPAGNDDAMQVAVARLDRARLAVKAAICT
jgi:hypothetical protein